MEVTTITDEYGYIFLAPQMHSSLLEEIKGAAKQLENVADKLELKIYAKVKKTYEALPKEKIGTNEDPYFHRCEYFNFISRFTTPMSLLFWSKISAVDLRKALSIFEVKGIKHIGDALYYSGQNDRELFDLSDKIVRLLRALIEKMILASYQCREIIHDPSNMTTEITSKQPTISPDVAREIKITLNTDDSDKNDLYPIVKRVTTEEAVKAIGSKILLIAASIFDNWLK